MDLKTRNQRLSARAERAFRISSPAKIIGSRKAIVGPRRLDLLVADAEEARRVLSEGGTPTPIQIAALEQAIRLQRPAPMCRKSATTPLPAEGNWLAEEWARFQPTLQRIQGSVARLDRIDDPDGSLGDGRSSVGTGFLVEADLLLTAAHVVDQLSCSALCLEPGQAIAEFEGYYGATSTGTREIVDVVAYDADLDLALLRLNSVGRDGESRPALLADAARPILQQAICVIGYPLDDFRNPSVFASIVFGNHFRVKRAAIGEIIEITDGQLFHDCSTAGGMSGSPIIDLASGLICAVHTGGKAMMRNDSISAALARNFVSRSRTFKSGSIHLSRSGGMKKVKPSIDDYFRELHESDPSVAKEMEVALDEAATNESAGASQDRFTRETIVLTTGRPILDIKSGATVIDITEVESQIWKQRLATANPFIAPNIPAVGRIEIANHPGGMEWLGTGWLIRDNVVVTNRHVAEVFGEADGANFMFRPGLDGAPMRASVDFLEEFDNSGSFEFPLFKIMHIERGGGPDLAFLRIEPVNGQSLPSPITISSTSAQPGNQIAIIGYPARDPYFPDQQLMDRIFNHRYDKKRLAPGLVTGKTSDRLFHDCTSLGGASGSAVVSLETGRALALHFAGTLFKKNHAVPIDVVAQRLDDVLNGRVAPVQPSRAPEAQVSNSVSNSPTSRVIEATIPIKVRVEIGDVSSPSMVVSSAPVSARPPANLDADDDLIETSEARPEDYRDRKGYLADFLGEGFEVALPALTESKEDTLSFTLDGKTHEILHYHHYSVLMSKSRRICRFSACNINGKQSKRTSRAGWQFDPRIPKEFQIMKECYGNPPKFSRGHMTRREDPAWGDKADLGNRDSMHVTNTVPQIQPFNGGVWLDLEDYALQNARKDKMQISVFTGPFLENNDPIRFDVKVPVKFWKVIAFIHDATGELCATGYTMSQKSFIGEEEFVFGRHENNQRPIAEIERRAGISFGPLSELDPLKDHEESLVMPLTRTSQIRFA